MSDYANAGVRPSSDFGCYNLLSIVIFLRAQAADTPRDHCMIFRVCSGGLEMHVVHCFISHPSWMAQDLRFVNAEKCCASSLLLKTEWWKRQVVGLRPSPDYIPSQLSSIETYSVIVVFLQDTVALRT